MTPAELVASKQVVLLDFDGPICSVFGGVAAEWVAAELGRQLGLSHDHAAVTRDPFDILRFAASDGTTSAADAERELTRLEVQAVATAPQTQGAADVLETLAAAGHTIAVVSNNSEAAVGSYLYANELEDLVHLISARNDADPDLLKPNPHLLIRAMEQLGAERESCVMVGDSITDIEAARSAGVQVIAYANKPGKRDRFSAVQPGSLIIDQVSELTT